MAPPTQILKTGPSLHHSRARRQTSLMRRRGLRPVWAMMATFGVVGACGGDYYLGGARGRSTVARDGGATTVSRDGGVGTAPGDGGANARVLTGDIVLHGDDSLALPAEDAGPCRLVGNGHSIRSDDTWVGRLTIRGCLIEGLGEATTPAIDVRSSGSGVTTIEGNTFSKSGAVDVDNSGDSTTTFNDNVILSDSTVTLGAYSYTTTPAFSATGSSTASKLFQGNHVYRSSVAFGSPNWLVGGSQDSESNILVGLRAGISLDASGLVLRGNYVHVLYLDGAGDETAVEATYTTTDTLAEHNVFRGGEWVFRGFGGELRYNEVLDIRSIAWVYQPFENTKIHHNVFLMCRPPEQELQAGIFLVNDRAAGIEIYNNTLHAGGAAMMLTGAAVAIDDGCSLDSFRSNLVFDFPFVRNDGGAAAVRPGITESVVPPPVRLGYADYNLFYNPALNPPRNYAVAVSGHTLRADAGFGKHDAHVGGPVDEQVNPGPLGFSGDCFPWSDDDIEASRVTVSRILGATRASYTPAASSAALTGGDPADGTPNFMGAVGDGTTARDLFGTFGR